MVTLGWIKAITKEYRTFVQNRVIQIRKNIKENYWDYCNANENPSDVATRISSEKLHSSMLCEWVEFVKRDLSLRTTENFDLNNIVEDVLQ